MLFRSPETERGLIAHLRAGVSYAAARERAAAERMGGDAARLLSPIIFFILLLGYRFFSLISRKDNTFFSYFQRYSYK